MIDRWRAWLLRWEAAWVWCLGALAFMAVPLWQGGIGLSWDALNHHIYLGWTAEASRFHLDYLAASGQSYQYPYLYWPVYRLALGHASGLTAGIVLALLHSLAIPPVWKVTRACCPGASGFDLVTRVLAVVLAFLTGVALVLLEVTSNDLLSAIPLLWAIAWALPPTAPAATDRPTLRLLASGLATGVAVAFKLSNGPLALVMPLLWMAQARSWPAAGRQLALACTAALAGLLLAYGHWGWQLWQHFGNPIYPLYDDAFEGARQALGWHP